RADGGRQQRRLLLHHPPRIAEISRMQRPQARPNAPFERPQAILVKIQPRLFEQESQEALFIFRERPAIALAVHTRVAQRESLASDRSSKRDMAKLRRPGRERLALDFNWHVPSPRIEIPTNSVLGHYQKRWIAHTFPMVGEHFGNQQAFCQCRLPAVPARWRKMLQISHPVPRRPPQLSLGSAHL